MSTRPRECPFSRQSFERGSQLSSFREAEWRDNLHYGPRGLADYHLGFEHRLLPIRDGLGYEQNQRCSHTDYHFASLDQVHPWSCWTGRCRIGVSPRGSTVRAIRGEVPPDGRTPTQNVGMRVWRTMKIRSRGTMLSGQRWIRDLHQREHCCRSSGGIVLTTAAPPWRRVDALSAQSSTSFPRRCPISSWASQIRRVGLNS